MFLLVGTRCALLLDDTDTLFQGCIEQGLGKEGTNISLSEIRFDDCNWSSSSQLLLAVSQDTESGNVLEKVRHAQGL
jgi:hypothetical protein